MDERLHELLDIWEEQRDQGVQLSAQELCAFHPEWFQQTPCLLDDLQTTMRQLEAFRRDILDPIAPGHLFRNRQPPLPSIENYRVERLAGQGGMGRVYLAQDEQLGLTVAIKVLDTSRGLLVETDRRRLAKRFVQEARTLAALSHPHIVRVFAGKPRNDQPYFAMEYLPRSLADPAERARLRQAGPRATAEFMVKVAKAVHYAHEHEVLHRDLKPANILLDSQSEPKVCDFGLAKLAQEADEGAPAAPESQTIEAGIDETAGPLTRAGHQPGTPAYMAPEQHDPTRGPIDARTDLWALGVMCYELLTGRKPFPGEDRATLRQEVLVPPLSPRLLRKDLSRDLEMICLKCLLVEPAQRYASCQELADDLRRFLEGRPIAARPAGCLDRTGKWARRQPIVAAFIAALIPLIIMGVVVVDRRIDATRLQTTLDNLGKIDIAELPRMLEDLEQVGSAAVPGLHRIFEGSPAESEDRFRAALALIRVAPDQPNSEYANTLYDRITFADPSRLRLISSALAANRASLTPRLWTTSQRPAPSLLRTACVLAKFDPKAGQWREIAFDVASALVQEEISNALGFAKQLKPIAGHLQEPLFARVKDSNQPEESYRAVAVAAELYADDEMILVDLTEEAEPAHFQYIVPKLVAKRDRVLPELQRRWTKSAEAKPGSGGTHRAHQRIANLAAAQMRLGVGEQFWSLLDRHSVLRPYLIQLMAATGLDFEALARRIEIEKDDSIRRALFLALGEYQYHLLPQSARERHVQGFLKIFRDDPDPGIHSAVEWLLERWGQRVPAPATLDPPLSLAKKKWYTLPEGHTMCLVPFLGQSERSQEKNFFNRFPTEHIRDCDQGDNSHTVSRIPT
jgi:tRNA A-37 threonylcarbamoyl transferase component Bud32